MIAVVDDEESIRKALVRLLEASGHAVRGFCSGNEFLQSWDAERPDCVMLDLQMPGLSGLDVQRALNLAGAHIPVIIITAHDTPRAREECLREGAIAYLCKPLDHSELLKAMTLAGSAGN